MRWHMAPSRSGPSCPRSDWRPVCGWVSPQPELHHHQTMGPHYWPQQSNTINSSRLLRWKVKECTLRLVLWFRGKLSGGERCEVCGDGREKNEMEHIYMETPLMQTFQAVVWFLHSIKHKRTTQKTWWSFYTKVFCSFCPCYWFAMCVCVWSGGGHGHRRAASVLHGPGSPALRSWARWWRLRGIWGDAGAGWDSPGEHTPFALLSHAPHDRPLSPSFSASLF